MAYFLDKARTVFARAQGDPDRAGQLADWARRAHAKQASRTSVVVTEQGDVIAEATYVPSTLVGATYVTWVSDDRYASVMNAEIGGAVYSLERLSGQRVIRVRYWEVCQGASGRVFTFLGCVPR